MCKVFFGTLGSLQVRGRSEEYRFVSRIRPDVAWVSFIDRRSLERSVPGQQKNMLQRLATLLTLFNILSRSTHW